MKKIDTQAHMAEAIQLINHHLPLQKWNFKEDFRYISNEIYPVIIYTSETCRVKFLYDKQTRFEKHHFNIHYGTIEVPDGASVLKIRDYENSHLYWHSIRLPLCFLDDLSPTEAYLKKEHPFIKEFEQSEIAKQIDSSTEQDLAKHAAIWETYGQRLFDLFDVKNTKLWEKYISFVKEFWQVPFALVENKRKIDMEIVKTKLPELVQMLENWMDFNRWGFKQSFCGATPEFSPSVIYDSEYCRVRFLWHKGVSKDGYEKLDVLYGRLHALDEQRFIKWNGRKSYAWHNITLALNFLDNQSPKEAFETRNKSPKAMNQFIKENRRKTMSRIEWKARLHAYVWNRYKLRLFRLFDLREPVLWEQYASFVKDYYRIAPFEYNYNVSQPWSEEVC